MPEEVRFQDFVCCAAVVASWKIPACRHTPKACAEKLWLHIFPNPHPPPSPRVSFVRLSKQRSGKALAGEACRGLSRALSTSSCKCCCIAVEHLQKTHRSSSSKRSVGQVWFHVHMLGFQFDRCKANFHQKALMPPKVPSLFGHGY